MRDDKYIVLDHGFVRLVDVLGSDLTVVNSARVSYGLHKEVLESADEKLIHYLARNNHTSPFRHPVLQFHCKVPEFIARQWYKHVVGINYSEIQKDHGWNEISGRYVSASSFDFYTPAEFRVQAASSKQASSVDSEQRIDQDEAERAYEEAIRSALHAYRRLTDMGVAKEQARGIIPLCFYTEFYWTVSLQALAHFIKLRRDPHAQYEIQAYADGLEWYAREHFPISMEALLS